MTPGADISVIIATMDRPDALARCLDSLLAGTVLPAEVIVVDQGSLCAREVIDQRGRTSRVPLRIIHQPRIGLAASRNAGIECAMSPVTAVTDDDCVPGPGWVEALERAFKGARPVWAVTGPMLPLGPDVPGLRPASSRSSPERRYYKGKLVPLQVGTGGNFAVNRERLLRAGGYDERLGAGSPGQAGEDIELLYRLLNYGATILYEPDAVVYHQQHTQERYKASRWSYGHGVGAFCGIWLRRQDLFMARVLGFWLRFHGHDLLNALRNSDRARAGQTIHLFAGTARGLLYGLRAVQARPARIQQADDEENDPCAIQ